MNLNEQVFYQKLKDIEQQLGRMLVPRAEALNEELNEELERDRRKEYSARLWKIKNELSLLLELAEPDFLNTLVSLIFKYLSESPIDLASTLARGSPPLLRDVKRKGE